MKKKNKLLHKFGSSITFTYESQESASHGILILSFPLTRIFLQHVERS